MSTHYNGVEVAILFYFYYCCRYVLVYSIDSAKSFEVVTVLYDKAGFLLSFLVYNQNISIQNCAYHKKLIKIYHYLAQLCGSKYVD